jgi:hypothetical protein
MGEPSGTPATEGKADALLFPKHHRSVLQSLLIVFYPLSLRNIKTILLRRSSENIDDGRNQTKPIRLNGGRRKGKF